jgi:hypothetical protein
MRPVWLRSILWVVWLPLRFMRSMYDLEVWLRERHHADPGAPPRPPSGPVASALEAAPPGAQTEPATAP